MGAILMVAAGAAILFIGLTRDAREWSLIGLVCMAIGFGRLHKAGR